jgi:membrane protein DedA with SNARE-associated domain
LEDWILSFISDFGYLGVFLLIMLENIFPPIPSEVILTFSGFATTTTEMTKLGVIIASTAGALLGAVILYWVGSFLSVEKMEKIVDKYGKLLQLKKQDIHRADKWFTRYGIWTVLFCRVIPLVRSLISIPAGMAKMKFPLFLLFTFIGTLIWNTVLVNVGASVGSNWHVIATQMDLFSNFVYAGIAIVGLVFIILYLRLRSKRKKTNFINKKK